MIIKITPFSATSSATPFLLGDDTDCTLTGLSYPNGAGGLIREGLRPEISFATQRDELIDSEYAQEVPRGNKQTTYTWSVFRNAQTSDQSAAFLADHGDLVPITGKLAVYIANTVRYLDNAVLKSIRVTEHSNLAFQHTYSYSGSYIPPITGGAGTGTGGTFTTS